MKHIQSDCFQDYEDGRIEIALGTPWVALGKNLNGFDCWGFVRFVLDLKDAPEAPFFNELERSDKIKDLSKQFIKVVDKTPYSIILMGKNEFFSHVGIFHPNETVYHCMEKIGVCGHRFRSLGIFGFDSFEFYKWGGK